MLNPSSGVSPAAVTPTSASAIPDAGSGELRISWVSRWVDCIVVATTSANSCSLAPK